MMIDHAQYVVDMQDLFPGENVVICMERVVSWCLQCISTSGCQEQSARCSTRHEE